MLDQPVPARKGEELNLRLLTDYLTTHLPGSGGSLLVQQFPGGFSNLTYLVQRGGKEYVLRRPPVGSKVKTAHDMGREFRILSSLKGWRKAPKPVLFCEDESVLGAPFYLMERVEGVILRSNMPPPLQPDIASMAGIAGSLVDTFVELHSLDYKSIGPGGPGNPEGYVERQISGWTKRYFNAKTDEVSQIEKAAAWLAENIPAGGEPALIHNDFKYDNLVLSPLDLTQVRAVLDWEMATIGDPLMDLGTTLGYWINHNDPPFLKALQFSPTTWPGNPTRSQLVEMYAEKSGREVGDAVFYYVYGLFKIAVIVQQIYFRYKKGLTQDARFAGLIEVVKGCGLAAMLAIEKKRVDDW